MGLVVNSRGPLKMVKNVMLSKAPFKIFENTLGIYP